MTTPESSTQYTYQPQECLRIQPRPVCSCLQKCHRCTKTGLCNEMYLIENNFIGVDGRIIKVFLCEPCHRKYISDICDR